LIVMAKTTSSSSDVRPLVAVRPSAQIRADVSGLTHPGRVRANNEDHFLVTRATRGWRRSRRVCPPATCPSGRTRINYVMVVADGMGGHAAGEVASRLAIGALVGLALQIPDWIFWVDDEHAPEIERRTREVVATGRVDADRART
jgi:protein phosphatase